MMSRDKFFSTLRLIISLAINDFREKYLGSYIGLLWTVVRPLIFVVVIWFIFTTGMKMNRIDGDDPFIIFLLCGYVPWHFFAEALSGGTNSLVTYRYLVNKVSFNSINLPIARIVSSLILHGIFLGILMVALLIHGYRPSIHWIQLPFFLALMLVLLIGVTWLTSSLRVFTTDITQLIGIVLQIGFWLTPIFWSISILPQKYSILLKVNPMVYIVEGYRNTFIRQEWFWEDTGLLWYFSIFTLFFLIIGRLVFNRLKPHFWDVL